MTVWIRHMMISPSFRISLLVYDEDQGVDTEDIHSICLLSVVHLLPVAAVKRQVDLSQVQFTSQTC